MTEKEFEKYFGGFVFLVLLIGALLYGKGLFDSNVDKVMKRHKDVNSPPVQIFDFIESISNVRTDAQLDRFNYSYSNSPVIWSVKIKNVKRIRKYYVLELESSRQYSSSLQDLINQTVVGIISPENNLNNMYSVCGKAEVYPATLSDKKIIENLVPGSAIRIQSFIEKTKEDKCVNLVDGIVHPNQLYLTNAMYKVSWVKSLTGINLPELNPKVREYQNNSSIKSGKIDVFVPENLSKYFKLRGFNTLNEVNIIISEDFSGDGLVDYVYFDERQGYCGAAGCPAVVLIANGDDFTKAYEGFAHQVDFDDGGKGRRNLVLSLNGSACSRAVFETCEKKLIWRGNKLILN